MTKKFGRGLGLATLVLALVGVPALSAYADSGIGASNSDCYTGCSTGGGGGNTTGSGGGNSGSGNAGNGTLPPVTKSAGGSGGPGTGSSGASGANAATVSTKAAGGGLPFTGADIEEMTIGGAGALLLGGVLLRRSRNRRRASV
jgi:hypothetical protein